MAADSASGITAVLNAAEAEMEKDTALNAQFQTQAQQSEITNNALGSSTQAVSKVGSTS
jgi:hypothetical protein